jgi:PTH1 family peptidyl-tRNA hydrolase
LLVLHDDIDLPFGTIRIKKGGGHGGQRGVRHISEVLGTRDYTRIRIGVGRPHPGQDAADYVLRPFTKEEESLLGQVLENAAGAVEVILADGEQKAMNLYHCKEVSV